jgi:hypothetical protein
MSLEPHGNTATGQAIRSGEASADRDGNSAKTLASAKKITANRLNAKKCTGPRTPRGKSHASLNALKHGVFARRRLIAGEDMDAYRELSGRVFAETRPRTAIEIMLADQIVGDIWRLRRVEEAERAYLEHVRASNLARAIRALQPIERAQAPKMQELPPVGVGPDQMSRSVRCKLNAASRADRVMLDAMVAPERAFPYSSLEQIRRSLIRDVLRKGSSLSELQAQHLTIETPSESERS